MSDAVSRIGAVSAAAGDEVLEPIFAHILAKRGKLLHIHQTVAHAPKMLRAQAAYAASLREDSSLPRDLQELLILRIAQINGSQYEQSVHDEIALQCGVPQERIDTLAGWQDASVYNPIERAALAFIEQAARDGEVDEATFAALEKHFTRRAIVELAALNAWYVGNARFVRALRIANEPGWKPPE